MEKVGGCRSRQSAEDRTKISNEIADFRDSANLWCFVWEAFDVKTAGFCRCAEGVEPSAIGRCFPQVCAIENGAMEFEESEFEGV